MEKKKNEIYKKWWFWIIFILTISIIIETVSFVAYSQNNNKKEQCYNSSSVTSSSSDTRDELIALAKEINTTLGNSSVYFSSDGSLMFVEIRNWKTEYNETKLKSFFKILENDYCKNNISTVTITTYFDDELKLVIRKIFDLKTHKELQPQESYIDFDAYSSLLEKIDDVLH